MQLVSITGFLLHLYKIFTPALFNEIGMFNAGSFKRNNNNNNLRAKIFLTEDVRACIHSGWHLSCCYRMKSPSHPPQSHIYQDRITKKSRASSS